LELNSSEGLSHREEVAGRRAPAPSDTSAAVDPSLAEERRAERYWRDVRRRRMLAVADLCAGAIGSVFLIESTASAVWVLAFLPGWVVIAKLLGLYDRDQRLIRPLTVDELPVIAAWAAVGVAVLGLLLPLTPVGSERFVEVAYAWLAATIAAFVLRAAARWLWRLTTPAEITAVLGEGDLAAAARRKLELFPDMHLRLVADEDLSVVGSNHDRPAALRRLVWNLDRVIVATERVDPALIGELAGICHVEQVKLSVVSPLRGRAGPAPRLSQVADLPVLEYDTRDVPRSTALIKRLFDVLVSMIALAIAVPVFLLIVIAIKLDSRGPVIFSQRRAGKEGRPFRMYKLRTMTPDAERKLSEVVSLDELPEPMFKLEADPRVTRVGRLLRRFSLDELPQLVNVLRGDMSMVGPRPEQVELVERYRPEHLFRLEVKPGMTGPMQVYGRGELDFSERLAVELDYVENISLARDLRILFQTIPTVLRGTGAY
jgi:exopolysaccharide biosynthesis polyprenyl glycosylphosphotransferase